MWNGILLWFCISLMTNIEHLFISSLTFVHALQRRGFKPFFLFLETGYIFLLLSSKKFFKKYFFWIIAPSQIGDLQIFSPIIKVLFIFSNSVLWKTNYFNCDEGQITYFFLPYIDLIWVISKKTLLKTISWIFILMFT